MPRFSRQRLHAYEKVLTVRFTLEQDAMLQHLAEKLELPGKAEVLRTALDYWLGHEPKVKEIVRTYQAKREKT